MRVTGILFMAHEQARKVTREFYSDCTLAQQSLHRIRVQFIYGPNTHALQVIGMVLVGVGVVCVLIFFSVDSQEFGNGGAWGRVLGWPLLIVGFLLLVISVLNLSRSAESRCVWLVRHIQSGTHSEGRTARTEVTLFVYQNCSALALSLQLFST